MTRPISDRIARAEALAARYLGNYNEALEAGRSKTAEKLLAKSQYWLDRANNLRGWGPPDPPGTLRIKDVGDYRVITLTGLHKELA